MPRVKRTFAHPGRANARRASGNRAQRIIDRANRNKIPPLVPVQGVKTAPKRVETPTPIHPAAKDMLDHAGEGNNLIEYFLSNNRTSGFDFPDRKTAAVAAAIILAESGGKADARNTNSDGSVDRGWWQINSRWHPEVSDACADNLICSTKAAKRISKNWTDFSAWTTYRSGAYKKHLGAQDEAVETNDVLGIGVPDIDPWGWLKGLVDPILWLRIGQVILGGIMLVVGGWLLAKVAMGDHGPSLRLA
jgi:Lysozyme like domain